ncbi:hypothetical protein [Geopsychrobacter electrodiphilus]|uniref:hypothetical protein n=1 Tax=Geopsychrobacter electrodiphilus TaxID=225196 RepID=UPI00037A0042|nr:hypothetical protein [Geopsychrobacter electrodiphilus]
MQSEFNQLVESGITALGNGETQKALALFERASRIDSSPTLSSCLAYCMARERGQVKAGHRTCEELINTDPQNLFHYLNLGRILLLENDRSAAIQAFRAGIALDPHPQIIRELTLLGVRKTPPIAFLPRGNILNKLLGHFSNR